MKRSVVKGILLAAVSVVAALYGCQTMTAHMDESERLYLSKCTSCHRPVAPESRTAREWAALLEGHGPKLTGAEKAAILTHLAGREQPVP